MSVLVIGQFPGDTAVFKKVLTDRADELVGVSEQARAAGAIHHTFAADDGIVVLVDEWESPQQFEQFSPGQTFRPWSGRWARPVRRRLPSSR
jgi:hypothetical protein